MFKQSELGSTEQEQTRKILNLYKNGVISLAGNRKLKIYGRLYCGSGKHMNFQNRVFFRNEYEALKQGYRPCGNCMTKKYRHWKASRNEKVS